MRRDTDDEKRDLEQAIEGFQQREFNAQTKQEKNKVRRELASHIARPELTDNLEDLVRNLEVRLKSAAASLLEGAPPAYREAFLPLLEKLVSISSPDQQEKVSYHLWTQHLVYFRFVYGMEPLRAILGLKAFGALRLPPEAFEAATFDSDEAERARKTQEITTTFEGVVDGCVSHASDLFVDALRGRLGSVIEETANEVMIRAISAELPDDDVEKRVAKLRSHAFDLWQDVEKMRLGIRPQGPYTFQHREELEVLIDQAQEKLKPAGLDHVKKTVVAFINEHYPQVRCGSVKQLNRLLDKFDLHHKFPEAKEKEKRGQSKNKFVPYSE